MTKQCIFPYYADTLRKVNGVEILDVDGAAMAHFKNVDVVAAQELKYPCRIDAFIMVVCVRGELSFSSHMRDYTLRANQLFISSASMFQFHGITDCEFYVLAFSTEFLTRMNVDVRFVVHMMSQLRIKSQILSISDAEMNGMERFFDTVYSEYTSKEMSEYMVNSLRHLYCAIIYRICNAVMDEQSSLPSQGIKDRSAEYFERLMTLLSIHYREQRNVEFYAENMNISSKHLSRVIRSYTGKSVHQWIDEFVALEIKNLLKYSNLSIQQISFELHFPNPSFMGQYFKRITGLTPGEYKKS